MFMAFSCFFHFSVFFNPSPMPMTLEVSSELEELATQGPARASNTFATGEIEGVLKGP
jgi:hypothetical protein